MTFRRAVARLRLGWRKRRFSGSVVLSLAIHAGFLALLIFAVAPAAPRAVLHAILVDLVQIGEAGESDGPTAGDETQKANTSTAASAASKPTPGGVQRSGTRAPDDVGALLRLAETAHGTPAVTATRPGGGAGMASGAETGTGGAGHAGLKDFIRAQIERRWQVDPTATPEMVITLRVAFERDGSVTSARVLSGGDGSPAYKALARDARNAALLSSPLQFPPGMLEDAVEVTVDLNTKDARR